VRFFAAISSNLGLRAMSGIEPVAPHSTARKYISIDWTLTGQPAFFLKAKYF